MFNLPKLKNNKQFEVLSIDESGEELELKYNDGVILLDYSKGYFEEVTDCCYWSFFDCEKNQELELKQIGKTTYLLKEVKTGIWNVFDQKEFDDYIESNPFFIEIERENPTNYEFFCDPYKQVTITSINELDYILYPEEQY